MTTDEEIKALVKRLRETTSEKVISTAANHHIHAAANALQSLSAQVQELRAENERLRSVVSKVCEALPNGAFCSPQCSIEFMENVPEEVAIVCKTAEKRLAEVEAVQKAKDEQYWLVAENEANLQADRDRLESALRPFADAAGSYDGESDEMLVSGASLRAKHLRAARAALSGSSDPQKDAARETDHG